MKKSLYKLSGGGISITCPEDGTFEVPNGQGGTRKEKASFADFITKTIASDGRFGADIHARRIGHEIRDAFVGKKAGEDSEPLSLEAAHALWAAVEKPAGGYNAIASQMPTSWLYAVPATNELPALEASATNAAARPACEGCGQPDDGHTHCETCGGHSGIAEGNPGSCTCNAKTPEDDRIIGRCAECGAPKTVSHACDPEALERARAVRQAARADEDARIEAAAAELARKRAEEETPKA